MKFAIVLKQDGEGCDYTIGCGMTMMSLESKTLAEALCEAKRYFVGTIHEPSHALMLFDRPNPPQPDLKYAKLVQVVEDLPIQEWYDTVVSWDEEKERGAAEAKERAEFERLKGKFGG
jgi:hypothetical protein